MTKHPLLHPFHLVSNSPWPILISFSIFNNLIASVMWMHNMNYTLMFLTLPCTLMCLWTWWRDIIRESTYQGFHSTYVCKGLRMGMILFITSEIFFFLSFFWAYFHSSLSPSIEIGQLWPPLGISPFNPFNIPLLNTIILVSSGLTVTWCHHSILSKNFKESKNSLTITILLGGYFSLIQLMEYKESSFTMADSIYGSTFFVATGFHGLHVLIGSLFLLMCLKRLNNLHFSSSHHFGFEAAAWYWHFVDIIWLFLYLSIYWWSY